MKMINQVREFGKDFTVKVVRDIEEFKKLKEVWDEIALKNGTYVPWLCWDWFALWLKYFLDNNKLFIILLYKGNELSTIAPFFLKNEKYKGIMNVKKIELIGNVHSPIRNLIFGDSVDNERADSVLKIFSYLTKEYKSWDILELDRIPEERNISLILQNALNNLGLRYRSHPSIGNWYLDNIHYSSERYFGNQLESFRKQIENKKNRLRKKGEWENRIITWSKSLAENLNLYDELREKSWKAPERDRDFNRDIAKLASDRGWLRFGFLFFKGIPIASQKWIVHGKTAYIWSLVYDEEFKNFSPGSILSSDICRYVIDQDRVTEIDYLVGDEPYKKFWTPSRRERRGITIFNNNLKGKSLSFLMTELLPYFEKNQYLLSIKNKLADYWKKYTHQ
jgi:hypothetical protein